MTEQSPDFAPDLEWMLQSGQVSQDFLLEALIVEYYSSIFHLALALLDDQKGASNAAFETFSQALVEIHQYRPQEGVATWLYRIGLSVCRSREASLKTRRTLKASLPFLHFSSTSLGDSVPDNPQDAEIWLAFDRLDLASRQASILHFLLGWDFSDLALLLSESEQDLRLRIQAALQAVMENLDPAQVYPNASTAETSRGLQDRQQGNLLRTSLLRRWSPPEISQSNLDRTIAQIARRSNLIGSRRQGIISFVEIALVAVIILIGVGIVWGIGRFESSPAPTPTATSAVRTVLVTSIVDRYVTATSTPLQQVRSSANPMIRIPRRVL